VLSDIVTILWILSSCHACCQASSDSAELLRILLNSRHQVDTHLPCTVLSALRGWFTANGQANVKQCFPCCAVLHLLPQSSKLCRSAAPCCAVLHPFRSPRPCSTVLHPVAQSFTLLRSSSRCSSPSPCCAVLHPVPQSSTLYHSHPLCRSPLP
jgi:hypothetical protein